MNNKDINLNEILISGQINVITDTNDKYIKFGIITKKYTLNEFKNVYVSLNISRELYYTFLDYFFKGNKVFIKGYLNSYMDKDNKIHSFVTVTEISDNANDILKGRNAPHIRYDSDGVMVWNGTRCVSTPTTDKELEEINSLLSEFK